MNPLSLPVGIAARVLGDLTALAAAARAVIPVAEAAGELDLKQVQDDLHTLARVAEDLPRVEGELTRRMDEMEDVAEAGVKQLERATAAAEAIVGSLPVIEGGIAQLERATRAAERLTDSLPLLERMTDAGEKLAGEGLDEVRSSRAQLAEARNQAEQLIAVSERAQESLDRASENVELALARAEPLQGLTERIARLNERLPGGGRGAGPP